MLMKFDRLILTTKHEVYRFNRNDNTIAYLLLEDAFSQADESFGRLFLDNEFIPRENQILVKVASTRELETEERDFLLSFIDGMLSFKPSIDYVVDFFELAEEIVFDYPIDRGFLDLIEKINLAFNSTITIKHIETFNYLIQD